MNRRTLRFAVPLLALVATGCELAPGQPDHIDISELEAPWVQTVAPTQLWVHMITEGNFAERCVTNFGGVMFNDSRGFICEVGPRPTVTP
tara:strand:+ start:210 stop:479 length:270 start_codon:yes stop_codon:yes gene_type:complete